MTQELLKELFDYDQRGFLVERTFRCNRWKPGTLVKRKSNYFGYKSLVLNGKSYLLHRLIFLWNHGYMPDYIDHANRNPRDNRIENLREATRSNNSSNSIRQNKNGFRGVTLVKGKIDRWCARIKFKGKFTRLGIYDTKEEAAKAYDKKAIELQGPFAVLNFPIA